MVHHETRIDNLTHNMAKNVRIIDSHVHLYPQSEAETLAWCDEGNPLNGQFSINEYFSAIKRPEVPCAFIFIETDRKNHLDSEEGWEEPLREIDWITRVAAGKPRAGEGHTADHARYCLGIVAWAPMPLGPKVLSKYVLEAKARAGFHCTLIAGFRYLVQESPKGTMTQPGFIDSLRWLGEGRYTFDLGVDQSRGDDWQLDEAVEMIRKAHAGVPEDKKVTVIISKISHSPIL